MWEKAPPHPHHQSLALVRSPGVIFTASTTCDTSHKPSSSSQPPSVSLNPFHQLAPLNAFVIGAAAQNPIARENPLHQR